MKTKATHDDARTGSVAGSNSASANPDRAVREEVVACAVALHQARKTAAQAQSDYRNGRIGSITDAAAALGAAEHALDLAVEALLTTTHGPSAGR